MCKWFLKNVSHISWFNGFSYSIVFIINSISGLYGKNNLDGLVINQVCDLLEDMIQVAIKFFFEKDEEKKVSLLELPVNSQMNTYNQGRSMWALTMCSFVIHIH